MTTIETSTPTERKLRADEITIPLSKVLETQFLGLKTDSEKSKLQRLTIFIPKILYSHISQIVRDDRFEYSGDIDAFFMHAMWLLLDGIARAGYPDKGLVAELNQVHAVRMQAWKAQRRREMRESIHQFDDELEAAIHAGPPDGPVSICVNWEMWQSLIDEARTEVAKNQLRVALMKSTSMRRAITSMTSWQSAGLLTPGQDKLATQWAEGTADWSEPDSK